jgi:hypothetical protein
MPDGAPAAEPRPISATRLVPILAAGLAAAVIGWMAGPSTGVEIVSDGGRLVVTAAGSRLEAPVAPAGVTRLAVSATDSIDPPGGDRLELETAAGERIVRQLPRRFRFEEPGIEPVGDWWVDSATATGTVWSADVSLDGPFALETTIHGRPLQAVSFRFEGARPLQVDVRRGLINNDLAVRAADGEAVAVTSIDPAPVRDLLAAAATLLAGVAAGAALLAVMALVAHLADSRTRRAPRFQLAGGPLYGAAVALVVLATVASAWVAAGVLEGTPHLPDEVVHRIQVEWLLDGRVSQAVVPWQAGLDVPHTYVVHGRWLAQYPFGWPMVMIPAAAAGLGWLVSPLLGGLAVWLTWGLGRELYGPRVAVVAAALVAVSPLMRLLAASSLSHAAEICLLLGATWAGAVALRSGDRIPWVTGGLLLGLASGVRPLPTAVLATAFGLIIVSRLVRMGSGPTSLHGLGWAVSGVLVGALPTLMTNLAVTGHPLQFAYGFAGKPMYAPANLGFGARNLDAILAHLPPQLFGWGWGWTGAWLATALPLALPWVILLRRRDRPADRTLFLIIGLLLLSLIGTRGHGLHGYGPRYLAEAVPFLALLTARGAFVLARTPAPGTTSPSRLAAILTAVLVGGLTVVAAVQLPSRLSLYRGYNHVDAELVEALEAANVRRGVVVFTRDDWRDWARAGPLLDPDPGAELHFVRFPGVGEPLCRAFADRPWWSWDGARLEPLPELPCDGGGSR